ncbi:MAG: hypothetical protein AAF098_02345, partial [Pseudomonadota bacterium]
AGSGGGIINNGSLNISNSTISDNSASRQGGGIALDSITADVASLTISDSNIVGNITQGGGGGILVRGNSTAEISGNNLTNNQADSITVSSYR